MMKLGNCIVRVWGKFIASFEWNSIEKRGTNSQFFQ